MSGENDDTKGGDNPKNGADDPGKKGGEAKDDKAGNGDGDDGGGGDGDDDDDDDDDDSKKKVDKVPHQKFHQEREKRKAAEKELEEYRAKEKAREEDEAKKKGEYQELFEKTKGEKESLEAQLKEANEKLEKYETSVNSQIEESLGQIKDKEDRETVEAALDGRSISDKQTLLPKLLKKYAPALNVNGGVRDTGKSDADGDNPEAAREKAKKDGNILGLLKNAPDKRQKQE